MKNQSPLVSVIIPIYNVEAYLVDSLYSVRNQTYKHFEAILVNDGSTDYSAQIATEFVQDDPHFRLIHQKNKGLSGARNTGLKEAKGDFVFYLDSDDVLTNNALELLVNAATKHQADVVQGNFYYDYPDYLLLNNQQKEAIAVYDREEAMWALLEHKTVLNFAWGKLIRRDLAQKHTFPEGKYYEDTFWKYKIIHDAEKYVALKQPVLYYLQRESAISGAFSIRNLDQLEGEIERLEFVKKHYPKKYEDQALKLLHHKVIHHYNLLQSLNKEDRQVYRNRLKTIEEVLQLKEKFPKASKGLFKKMNRLAQSVKDHMLGSKDWQRIEK